MKLSTHSVIHTSHISLQHFSFFRALCIVLLKWKFPDVVLLSNSKDQKFTNLPAYAGKIFM